MAIAIVSAERLERPAHPPHATELWSWLTTVDHKRIGIMYFVTSLCFLFVGGLEALIIRAQLWGPDQALVSAETGLGEATVPLLLALSAGKFLLVVMFFMHLKFDSRLFTVLFLAGLSLAVFMVSALVILYHYLPRFRV